MGNGTFVHSTYLPSLGYLPGVELDDDDDRRKRGLAPRPRMADLDDAAGRQRNYVSGDADWINFAASACTSPDQIAFVPGYLSASGRRRRRPAGAASPSRARPRSSTSSRCCRRATPSAAIAGSDVAIEI